MTGEGCQAQRLGGCQTTAHDFGLPAVADSLVLSALGELMAPGMGPKTGPHCRQLGADTPLFAQIGAVDSLPNEAWVDIAGQLTAQLETGGVRIGERSQLRHTTGPCFPPYHVDFRGVADSASVAAFLSALPRIAWDGFVATAERSERRFFITAGMSLQQMDIVVDLR